MTGSVDPGAHYEAMDLSTRQQQPTVYSELQNMETDQSSTDAYYNVDSLSK